jgi:hypothetical protein
MGHEGIGYRNHLIDAHANKENAMHDVRNMLDSSGRPESAGSAQSSHSVPSNADGMSVQS